jgi:hypothetical protein
MMVSMIESILKAELGVLTLSIDHPLNIFDGPSGGLFAENVKICLETRNGNLGSKVIRQTNEQDVQFLFEQRIIIGVVPDPIIERTALFKSDVANRSNLKCGMTINVFMPPLADYPVARYANLELFVTQLN